MVTDLWVFSGIAADFLFSKQALSKEEFTFIPSGIELERFRFNPVYMENTRHELGLYKLCNVGRLCYQKNQTFLLDVFVEALKLRPESCFLLDGDGEEKPMLIKKAEKLDVQDEVIFCGTTRERPWRRVTALVPCFIKFLKAI